MEPVHFPEKNGPAGVALVALGGFGRKWLFPHSDIDLLFLHENERTEKEFSARIRQFSQEIWDLRMKLSPATRKISECDRFDPENLEFTVSLLDARYLAGDPRLFAQLQDAAIPKLLARDGKGFSQRLADLTRTRHAKFGETVFHLEPNIKDGPGGLRDTTSPLGSTLFHLTATHAAPRRKHRVRCHPPANAPIKRSIF